MKWLLIDSCGAEASLAVGAGAEMLASKTVPGRSFSAAWPVTLRGILQGAGFAMDAVEVVGVVGGPGSFTGVRVGLAVAKGLCEATGMPLVAMSRLEVISRLGTAGAIAVMDAGRDEFYLRDEAEERVVSRDQLVGAAQQQDVVTDEQRVAAALAGARRVEVVAVNATSALGLLLERVEAGAFADLGSIDANYIRGESEMYAGKGAR